MNQYPYPETFSATNIFIKSSDGGVVEITPYGAHVLSWKTADQRDRLYLSPKAEFRSGYAIRGGVPIIFPQFSGLGRLPKHGFARTQTWNLVKAGIDNAIFQLSHADLINSSGQNEASWAAWPYNFQAEYTVKVGDDQLTLSLSVKNTGHESFSFTSALHTYLEVNDSEKTSVRGLNGLIYRDSAAGGKESREWSREITFKGEIDRIYLDAPASVLIIEDGQSITVNSEGFHDVVVWNPGAQKCATLTDMEPGGYRKFICIEAAVIANPVHLLPGNTWCGAQILKI